MTGTGNKTAAALIIGNEILTGRTQDANLGYIGKKLMTVGVRLAHARIVPDSENEIVAHVNDVRVHYDYVFTTGGIGPTHDDITAGCVAKAFGVALELNKEAKARLVRHYGGEEHLNEARLRMAMIPAGAKLIDNPVSAAPGFLIENVYVLAGVPRIAQAMIDGILLGLHGGPPIRSRSIGCFVAESMLAKDLGLLAERYADLDIGSYPYFRPGGFGLSLVIRGTDVPRLDAAAAELCGIIKKLGGEPVLLNEDAPAPTQDFA